MAEPRKISGEWTPPPISEAYVTQGQFGAFTIDFREFTAETKSALTRIVKEMAEGNTQFALLKKDIGHQGDSLDSHSNKLRILEDKEKIREQREAYMALQSQPRQYGVIATTIIQTIVGVCVVGVLGYFYLSFLQVKEQEKKDNQPTHTVPLGKTP